MRIVATTIALTQTEADSHRLLPQPRHDHIQREDVVLAMEGHALAELQLVGAGQSRRGPEARDKSATETTGSMKKEDQNGALL